MPTAKELNELRHAGYSVAITVPKKAGQAMTLARFALACGPLRVRPLSQPYPRHMLTLPRHSFPDVLARLAEVQR